MRPVAKKVGAWQSPMKITKRLIASIIMLALSVAFCVWAVFAWFSQNSRVDATGMQVEVEVEDLKLEVELYSLAYVTVKGTQRYEITGELQGNMPQYGSGQCTAILVRMTATNSNATEDRTAALSVTCNGGTTFTQDTDNNGTLLDSFSGALSNAISFSGVSYDGADADATNTYALTGTPVSFVGNRGLSSKSTEVFLTEITIPAGQSVVRNYILDYDSDSLSAVYDAILNDSNLNASPSAVVNLQNDLTICLGNTVGGTNISTSDDSNTEGACRHTVTLNYNYQVSSEDGTSSDFVETYEVINGETYTPPAPEREGFTFGGWFTDSTLSTQYTPRAITANTTLYAKWDEVTTPATYTLTLNAGNGTFASINRSELVIPEQVTVILADLEVPELDDYTFSGWSASSGGEAITDTTITLKEDTTLYAVWTRNQTGDQIVESYRVSENDSETVAANGTIHNSDYVMVSSTVATARSDSGKNNYPTINGIQATYSYNTGGTNVSGNFAFTAKQNITISVYVNLSNASYGSNRAGDDITYMVGNTSNTTTSTNRNVGVIIQVELQEGETLTISESVSDCTLWFFGYDVVLT